jgi:hypothetical protein
MSDQPPEHQPDPPPGEEPGQPGQPSGDEQEAPPPVSSARPAFTDAIRAKMEEYEVDRHLSDLASTVEHAVRQGVAAVGQLAHDHRGDIERLLDKAAEAVDRRTEGRHADKISQVRGSIERGVDKIADHRPDGSDERSAPPTAE